MTEFFAQLTGFEKILWWIAIPSSIILLGMTILTFIGMDSSDMDADFDGDIDVDSDIDSDESFSGAFQLFTFRNFVYFFTMFSWVGIACLNNEMTIFGTIVISTASGTAMMFLVSFLFFSFAKLQTNNTRNIRTSIGKNADVYLTIPEKGSGAGKVVVNISGSNENMNARSNGPEFKTGSKVKVINVENGELIVDEIN